MPLNAHITLLPSIIERWKEFDPNAAGDFLVPVNEGKWRGDSMFVVMKAMMKTNPAAARSWLEALPAGNGRREAWQWYINFLARTNATAAFAYLKTSPPEFRWRGAY